MRRCCLIFVFIAQVLAVARGADAQGTAIVEFRFKPTARSQLALWVERPDGSFVDTLRLTESVSLRGIGNRPGALQMNSGFRWPYGRREGTLPVWAHRRAAAEGAKKFSRVIFQDRSSEGYASRTSSDSSPDDYFCLSFDKSTTSREALDAVTCASVFNSDKGRFITDDDVRAGYAEPFVDDTGKESMRSLGKTSLYPPRRDLVTFHERDHKDVRRYVEDSLEVMPKLDAITMATPKADQALTIAFRVPDDWEDGEYVAFLEVSTEGDYNRFYDDQRYPTPLSSHWDVWAETFGYPYRGQPSVVFAQPFTLGASSTVKSAQGTSFPIGYGSVHGELETMVAMDGTITDDPVEQPGSGTDRLRLVDGLRFVVNVLPSNVCDTDDPPPVCAQICAVDADCPMGFLCGSNETCVGQCDLTAAPSAIADLTLDNHPNSKWSHWVAVMEFTIPASRRALWSYELISRKTNGDLPGLSPSIPVRPPSFDENGRLKPSVDGALQIPVAADCVGEARESELCAPYIANGDGECERGTDSNADGDCLDAGDRVQVEISFQQHEASFEVEVRPVDVCQAAGPPSKAEVHTTEIDFATVDPCFVATAAYGTPLADEIWVLRRFRDRYLLPNALGRALVDTYYVLGPHAAKMVAEHPWLRTITRHLLTPVVAVAAALTDDEGRLTAPPERH